MCIHRYVYVYMCVYNISPQRTLRGRELRGRRPRRESLQTIAEYQFDAEMNKLLYIVVYCSCMLVVCMC